MPFSRSSKLEKVMDNAATYKEWRETAKQYDQLKGFERWRSKEASEHYDFSSIRERLEDLSRLREKGDNAGLLFALNEGIHGNMGGMGKQALYSKSRIGTKRLIEAYISEIDDSLLYLASPQVDDISFEEKLDFFRRAQHCYGRSALMMSGSGTLFYFHIGVVRALLKEHLVPGVISGSSGGGFIGAALATHTDTELDVLLASENLVFGEAKRSILDYLMPMPFKLLEVDEVKRIMATIIPDMTFQEAYAKTGRHLNISIAPAEKHQTSRLLNAITSPNAYIREAILASAAVPGIYPPVALAAKDSQGKRQPYVPEHKWVDGSVSDDLPTKRLARLYGVNHYIVSQTNPHVIPFITDANQKRDILSLFQSAGMNTTRYWVNASANVMKKPLSYIPPLQKLSTMMLSIINQDYIGDINIVPPFRFYDLRKILSHLTEKEIQQLVNAGERATWPKIDQIRIQTRIGRTLDTILHDFEAEHVEHVNEHRKQKA